MIRFLSGKLKKHTKLAKIIEISEIFNRLVFPLNFNRFCHPMTLTLANKNKSSPNLRPKVLDTYMVGITVSTIYSRSR